MAYKAGSVVLNIKIDDTAAKTGITNIKNEINTLSKDLSKIKKSFNFKLSTNLKNELKTANELKKTLQDIQKLSKSSYNGSSGKLSQEQKIAAEAAKQRAAAEKQAEQYLKRQAAELKKFKNDDFKMKMSADKHFSQQENQNVSENSGSSLKDSFNSIFTTSMKFLKVMTAVSAVISAAQTSINVYTKTIKGTLTVLGNSVKYFTQMNVAAAKFVYTFSGAKTVVDGLISGFSYLGDKIKSAFSVSSIENFLNKCAELGSSLTEVENIITKTFGSDSSEIDSWASSLTGTFGLTELTAKNFSGNIGAILSSAGVANDAMATMSKNVVQLSGDMASFFNDDTEDTFTAIRSALTGQVRPMLQYGVSTHAATLEQYLLKEGIDASYESLNYASKKLVQHNYIMETLVGQMGDFSDTQWTFANQQRLLNESWSEFQTILGQALNYVLTPVLIVCRAIVSVLKDMASVLLTTIQSWNMFKEWNITLGNSANTVEGLSDLYDDMGTSISDAAKEAKKAVSSFDELHKLNDDSSSGSSGAGIDITDLLDVWDNYPVLDPQSHPLYEATIKLIDNIKAAWADGDFTNIGKWVGSKITKGLTWLSEKWDSIFSTVKNFGKSIATFLNGVILETDFEEVGITLQNSIKTILYTAFSSLENLDGLTAGNKIGDFLNGLFLPSEDGESGLTLFTKTFGTAINKIGDLMTGAAKNINAKSIGNEIASAINTLIEIIDLEQLGQSIGSLATKLTQALSIAFSRIEWDKIGEELDGFLQGLFTEDENGNTFLDYAGNMAVSFVNGLIDSLHTMMTGEGLTDMNTEISEFFQNIKDNIEWGKLADLVIKIKDEVELIVKEALSGVNWGAVILTAVTLISDAIPGGLAIISGVLLAGLLGLAVGIGKTVESIFIGILDFISKDLIEGIQNFLRNGTEKLTGFLDGFDNSFTTWLSNMVEGFSLCIDGLLEILQGIIEFIAGIFTGDLDRAWEGVKSVFKGAIDVISGWLSGLLGWFDDISEGIKDAGKKIKEFFDNNGTTTYTSEAGITHGGSGGTFNLPHLASGGYLRANMPTLAVVGDNRTQGEIVAPEGKMFEVMTQAMAAFFGGDFMTMLANAIASAMQGYNGSGDVIIPLNIDGTELARIMLSQQDIEMARRG